MAKRVYFAFHYQDVINFRANVVRNHNALTSTQKAGYFDASIWEEAKKTSSMALKRMINAAMKNTSVTTVLIGTDTYKRPWVCYEIFHSIEVGNNLIGIHINSIKGKDGFTKTAGRNPFEYLGLSISSDGKTARPTIWNGTKWIDFKNHDTINIKQLPISERNKHLKLSHWFKTKDWVTNNGNVNFKNWI